jgi:hypothetical protein
MSLTSLEAYFVSLGLSDEEATDLNLHYYSTYGLALRGLVRYHDIGEVPSNLFLSYQRFVTYSRGLDVQIL